ncbi:50S ribosomal protein L5 [Buchnera aphidicola (Hormaphis cornu)]|nr:50S ribosomal protein L5 [Buchnera aphidicola (Hormaphis cornu)]
MVALYDYYRQNIRKDLKKKFGYSSIMQIPNINKITLNMGIGMEVGNKKVLNFAMSDLMLISGQKPIVTRAKKSIASFKIRKDYPIGCKVTLRGKNKWNFLDKLITIVIPRIRDFRGFSKKSFDGFGNYSIGIREHIIFPEINYDKIDKVRGLDISITTTAISDQESFELLKACHFPFLKE